MTEREPIGVVGAGWVGLVTAACFAELGHRVVVREILPEKLEALRRGELPIYEPGLDELVAKNAERLTFTGEMEELTSAARLTFVCVQTPPTYSGDADLSAVMRAVEEIGDGDGRALVMKSTVPVGTGRTIRRQAPGIAYVSCPEFLREGTAVRDFLEPDRVVIGAEPGDEWAADAVAAAYEGLGAPIVRTDVPSAEMIKLASNAFLATKISFINEIANVCDETGADVTEVARGMGLDERIGPKFLNAGLGFGGSCLVGEEEILTSRDGVTGRTTFSALYETIASERGLRAEDVALLPVTDLEVASMDPETGETRFFAVEWLTRRAYEGELVRVMTERDLGLRTTTDHPFVVGDHAGADRRVVLAGDLGSDHWLPVAAGLQGHADALSSASGRATATLVDRATWARVFSTERERFIGPVYSMHVPGVHTFASTGGLVTHNCFPKDTQALKMLAGNIGYHFQLLGSVIEVNELQKRRVVAKLTKHLGSLEGKRVALLGLAFKPDTDDMREASSLVLAARLQGEGAKVVAFDPVAHERASDLLPGVEMAGSALDALEGADAAVVVTEWPEFAELDWADVHRRMAHPLVVDGRNFLDAEAVSAAGVAYEGIGRRAHGPKPAEAGDRKARA